MKELFEEIFNWIKNSGFAEIASIGSLGTTIGALITIGSKLKKATVKEIQASANQIQVSAEYKETSAEITEIKNNQEVLSETINRLSALLLVVLNNSKISAEAKQQALDIVNATSEVAKEVCEKVKTVSEVVEQVASEVEKQVKIDTENQVEANPYISNLEDLINQ